jgi:hypothetical protein
MHATPEHATPEMEALYSAHARCVTLWGSIAVFHLLWLACASAAASAAAAACAVPMLAAGGRGGADASTCTTHTNVI